MMRTQANPAHLTAPHDLSSPGASVAVGEIRTGLLRHGATLTRTATTLLLDLLPGEPVLESQRPIQHALSPDVANGIDCLVAGVNDSNDPKTRAVGTILTHAAITGGRVLQTSTYTHIDPSGSRLRQEWSHYTAQPGRLETVGRADAAKLAAGFTQRNDIPAPGTLDLGSVSERLALRLQASPILDGRPPIKFQWTRLRWAVLYAAKDDKDKKAAKADFTLLDDTNRAVTFVVPYDLREDYRLADVLELCRDLALHDWMLTTLTRRIERVSAVSGDRAQAVSELYPTVSNLLHLWLPGARVSPHLEAVWTGFERQPGFTRQWRIAVDWVRDQLSLHTLRLLGTLADKQAL